MIDIKIQIKYFLRSYFLNISLNLFSTNSASIVICFSTLSDSKLISSINFSIIACNLLAPKCI